MKKLLSLTAILALVASCSLDTVPHDALSTATFPQKAEDVELLAIGCYDGWTDQTFTVYNDVFSDNGICTINGNWARYANGTTSHATPGIGWFTYSTITRCNNFLNATKDGDFGFKDPDRLDQLRAEIRFLRAFRYYSLCTAYGDVPLITDVVTTLEEARVKATPENQIADFIISEMDQITADLPIEADEAGRITKGAALALKMRTALHYKYYPTAESAADDIISLNAYSLYSEGEKPYEELFKEKNEDNSEVILAMKRCMNDYKNQTIIEFCNPADGGWAAFNPTQDLVDAYEMSDGKTVEEAQKAGEYDPVHPFKNRDPRFYATVLYPGADWCTHTGVKRIFNTLDEYIDDVNNVDHIGDSNNSSKTGYITRKYMNPLTQYTDINNTGLDWIVFRYAEVLLAKSEALIEQNKNLDTATILINMVRTRAGMPAVDKSKYSTQETLRELLRRERRVEFAFEGLRRTDLMRWGLTIEKLNGKVYGCPLGTVMMDYNVPETERAVLTLPNTNIVEERHVTNVYMAIPQSELDYNTNLKQTNFK